jgi:hypothetical protein
MQDELRERKIQEVKDGIRQERKEQALAVCEAAYNRIKMAVQGQLKSP